MGLGSLVTVTALAACGGPSSSTAARAVKVENLPAVPTTVSAWDWPSYGDNAQHTFTGRTTLTSSSVRALKKAWFFPTSDAVTATPTVVGGTVYAGSWDDYFYAVDLETGKLRWKVRLHSQNGITPYPGQHPRTSDSDGGLVTSSAWFEPASANRPALVIFGGGYTLYALEARNGSMYWTHTYSGLPGPLEPNVDDSRIFSSPVVVGNDVIFGVDVDGQPGSAGYVVAADLDTGDPVWEFQTDVATPGGPVLDDSCGSVWSSGTVLPDLGLVVFGTADCHEAGNALYAESIIALRVSNGTLAWEYSPLRGAPVCDFDFGASANAGVSSRGVTTFLGEGNKDGTYYSLDPATGRLLWSSNVVFGGGSGGFLGTTAYDGHRVYGSTGIGDFNPSPHGNVTCDPSNPRDQAAEEPTTDSFDAATGKVVWQADHADSFAPTTVAGGMTFNGLLAESYIQVRRATSGKLLARIALPAANWSGIATVGDALVFGMGTDYSPDSSGIEVVTPGGAAPVVPTSG